MRQECSKHPAFSRRIPSMHKGLCHIIITRIVTVGRLVRQHHIPLNKDNFLVLSGLELPFVVQE
jgi:hypothetical protein